MPARQAHVRVAVVTVIALLAAGCSAPLGGTPSAAEILAKPERSGLRDAHFAVTYTSADGKTKQSGDGTVQLQPGLGVSTQQTTSGETAGTDAAGNSVTRRYTVKTSYVELNGVGYTQRGQEKWDRRAGSTEGRGYAPWLAAGQARYIGEESVNGQQAWHVRAAFGLNDLDLWVSESNGHPIRFTLLQATYTFDRFDTGAQVRPPLAGDVRGDPKTVSARIGEVAHLNDADLTVQGVVNNPPVAADAKRQLKAGERFVVLQVAYQATSYDPVAVDEGDWALGGAAAAGARQFLNGSNGELSRMTLSGQGASAQGLVTFAVPSGAHGIAARAIVPSPFNGEDPDTLSVDLP
jgi:hypothetical protein